MTEKVGMLEEHLKFIGKTSDRRKCSRSALAEANVDKRVAGKKGSTNKYRCLLLMMRLRAPANAKLDGTERFIAITTGLFFVFYRKRRKFARVETTTSIIGKESYFMT